METLTSYLAVAAGGALGAMLRYFIGGTVFARARTPFPLATFVINVTGSFVVPAPERRRRARHPRRIHTLSKVVTTLTESYGG